MTKINKIDETMNILSEECAEVIQAISKCNRFGLTSLKPGKQKTNLEHLEEELGDLLAMIDILNEMQVTSTENLEKAKQAKFEKLKKWSSIYSND